MTDFKAKMHQIRFRLGSAPDPARGAYSALPDPLAGFGGPTSKERGREGRGREKRGREEREGEEKERAMSPPHYLEEVYAYATNMLLGKHESH